MDVYCRIWDFYIILRALDLRFVGGKKDRGFKRLRLSPP